MDDFTTFGVTFEEALKKLKKVLIQCKEHNLSLNSEKYYMMMQEGVVLGHFISKAGIQVDPAKVEVILTLPTPIKPKEIRYFLGNVGYYRSFNKKNSQIAIPLYTLLTKEAKFSWAKECHDFFLQLKSILTTAPILRGVNWTLPFKINRDASNYAIGAILGQKSHNLENAIYYISKSLHGLELNYIVTEKNYQQQFMV